MFPFNMIPDKWHKISLMFIYIYDMSQKGLLNLTTCSFILDFSINWRLLSYTFKVKYKNTNSGIKTTLVFFYLFTFKSVKPLVRKISSHRQSIETPLNIFGVRITYWKNSLACPSTTNRVMAKRMTGSSPMMYPEEINPPPPPDT